jgi:hypothetical protein
MKLFRTLFLLTWGFSPIYSEMFYLPPVPANDLNITELTTGYNPWMNRYSGSPDPQKLTFVLMTGGCLPLEEGGSDFYQDTGTGFRQRCKELNISCQCRPIIKTDKMNPPQPESLFNGMADAVWEVRRVLEEHRQGRINVGGISAKLSYQDPEVFNEARELGVPIFLMGDNQPYPDEMEYIVPQPTGFIGTDEAFVGRTMARLLQQLRPSGGTYGFVTDWTSPGMRRRRLGFVEEISKDNEQENRPDWFEVDYPFNTVNVSKRFADCDFMTCQMELLANPATKTDPTALIILFQSPLRHSNYTTWVDTYRSRGITLIAIDALDYLSYLSTGYVDGLVGQITFEMGTRSAEVLSEVAAKGIGVVPPDTRLFGTKLVSYNLIPLELDKVYPIKFDENALGSVIIVGYTCFATVVLSAFVCFVWTVYNRSVIVVRAAQPFFLLILLGGIVILSGTIIPLSFDDGGDPDSISSTFAVGICMSVPWLAFTGFTVMFSALFSKTWRINKLFQSGNSFTRIQVSAMDVLAPFAVIFTCNVIVLICWTALDPLTYTRVLGGGTDFWNREIESYGTCRSENAVAFLAPLACINFAVVAIACWQAFKGRNISSEFAESNYIGLSVASLFQVFLTGLPIVVIVKDYPRAFYLVLVLMIFVLSEVILLLIFLPKIYLAYQYSGMSKADQNKAMRDRIEGSTRSCNEMMTSWLHPTTPAVYGDGANSAKTLGEPESDAMGVTSSVEVVATCENFLTGENVSAGVVATGENDVSDGEKLDTETPSMVPCKITKTIAALATSL